MPSHSLYVLGAVFAIVLFAGCTTGAEFMKKSRSPLTAYIEDNGFTPFNPPRSGDGAGTIIQFNSQKEESIVFDAKKCFPRTSVPIETKDIAALEHEYTLRSDSKLELSLPVLAKYKVDVKGAIGSNGVKSVNIKFDAPVIQRIAKGYAKDYVRSLNPADTCVEEITRDSNLVIHSVLGARGVEYTFNGEGGNKLSLTAEILNSMKVNPETSQQFKGASSLKFKVDNTDKDQLMLFGYRAWRATEVPGALKSSVELLDLSREDMKAFKK